MSAALNVVQLPERQVLAEPPVPPECDLSGYRDMKLDWMALTNSKTWAVTCKRNPALGYYNMNLWLRGWQEKPAGSLPNDDDELCEAAKCDPAIWPTVRPQLLSNWVFCRADGRLYHLFLCEKVKEAWDKRLKWRERARKGGEAKAANAKAGAALLKAGESSAKGEGEGREIEDSASGGLGGGEAAGETRTTRQFLEADGVAMLMVVTGRAESGARSLLGTLCQDAKDHDDSVLRIIQAAFRAKVAGKPKADAVPWMRRALQEDAKVRAGMVQQQQRPRAQNQSSASIEHFMTGCALPVHMDDRPFVDHEGDV